MCIACRQMKPKNTLVRLVLLGDGTAKIDLSGKVNGRGVYVCKCKECITKLKKIKNTEKNYGFALTDELAAELSALAEEA